MKTMQDDHAPTQPQDERVGLVRGDRLCQQCAYNLTGQPVLRERHYDMLIVRCPECGAVAAIQQQPVLAQWLGKLHGLWLGAWLIVVMLISIGGTAAIAGYGFGTSTSASFATQEALRKHYLATLGDGADQNLQTYQLYQNLEFDTWWAQQDVSALRRELGGLTALVDWSMFLSMLVLLLVMTAGIGVLWAAVLIHWPRTKLLIWWLVLTVMIAGWTMLFAQTVRPSLYAVVSIWDAATALVGVPLMWSCGAIASIVLFVSLFFGRSILRMLVRSLLPPRMQASLGTLWRTDGLEPPSLR